MVTQWNDAFPSARSRDTTGSRDERSSAGPLNKPMQLAERCRIGMLRRSGRIGLFAFNVLVNLFVVAIGGGEGRAPVRRLGQATLAALVWIPYFLVSKRVKATFTE